MAFFGVASSDMIDRMGKDLREEVRFVVAPCRRGVSPERLGVHGGQIIFDPLRVGQHYLNISLISSPNINTISSSKGIAVWCCF